MRRFPVVFAALGLFVVPFARTQDLRQVSEPTLPAACVVLDAHLHAAAGQIQPADETKLDSARIQQAIDHCTKGHAVVLQVQGGNNAFLSGPLQLRAGVTLLVGRGVTLFGSRNPVDYQVAPGTCGLVNEKAPGCKPLISVDHASDAGVMGDGVIDGRGGATLLGQNVTWWQLAEQARSGGRQQVPRILVANYSDNFTLYRITLKNSPNFHVVYNHGDGFTVWGIKIDTPGRGARNTDGVDPGNGARNVTIAHSYIRTGDDNVAIKGGEGGIANVSILHNHFYWGHGMSIGSETFGGVSKIRVEDLSLDGPDNGIRLKSNASRGGLVEDAEYKNVCIRNSPNPIFVDTDYSAAGQLTGNLLPVFKEILFRDLRIEGGGKLSFNGYSADHRIAALLDGVTVLGSEPYSYSIRHADFRIGPGSSNLKLTGTDSTLTGAAPGAVSPRGCSDMFVPFPNL